MIDIMSELSKETLTCLIRITENCPCVFHDFKLVAVHPIRLRYTGVAPNIIYLVCNFSLSKSGIYSPILYTHHDVKDFLFEKFICDQCQADDLLYKVLQECGDRTAQDDYVLTCFVDNVFNIFGRKDWHYD